MSEQENYVVLGDTICEFEQPTNAVRWLRRNRDLVLQQCWIARGEKNGQVTYVKEQWRDVPIVDDPQSSSQA